MYCNVCTKIYHVNETLYYKDFSKEFLKYTIHDCLSNLLQIFPTYIEVEFVWLTDGKGCILKKIIIKDQTAEKINVMETISKIDLQKELHSYMIRTGWKDDKYKELDDV